MNIEHFLTKIQAALYALFDKEKAELIKIKTRHLTYLATKDLFNLYKAAKAVEQAGIRGVFIETGCALGGSAIAIGKAKSMRRRFRIYDTFGMIPPPTDKDGTDVHVRYQEIKSGRSAGIGGDMYYGYTENLQEVVAANLDQHGIPPATNNITLVKGYFEDTLAISEPVAFAHVDCDWYESVKVCLHQIVPNLAAGGKIVFDDYYEWSGCRRAVDEYFEDKRARYGFKTIGKKLHITNKPH